MNRTGQIRHEQEIASRARPIIIEHLCNRRDPAWIGDQICEQFPVDRVKAFRWVQYIDEEYQRVRRQIVNRALLVIWVGTVITLAGGALRLFGVVATPLMIVSFAVGVPLMVVGAVRIRSAYRLAGRAGGLSV